MRVFVSTVSEIKVYIYIIFLSCCKLNKNSCVHVNLFIEKRNSVLGGDNPFANWLIIIDMFL